MHFSGFDAPLLRYGTSSIMSRLMSVFNSLMIIACCSVFESDVGLDLFVKILGGAAVHGNWVTGCKISEVMGTCCLWQEVGGQSS